MSTITHETAEQFYNTIGALVVQGIIFDADASRLTITLTGGY